MELVLGTRSFRRGIDTGVKLLFRGRSQNLESSSGLDSQRLNFSNFSRSCLCQQTSIEKSQNIIKGVELAGVKNVERALRVTFTDKTDGVAPYLWLRDNCQCPDCFDGVALARKFLIENLKTDITPEVVENDGKSLRVTWSDSHISTFDAKWLHQRSFSLKARKAYHDDYSFTKEPWGRDLALDHFQYNELMVNDKVLLKWLRTMEVKGVSLIKNAPDDPDAGAQFIDHVGYVKLTHFGRRSPVYNRENANNVAYTNVKLGLHTDLPYYDYQPGMIFIQTVKQHEGKGGESVISDGLYCGKLLQDLHPEAFELLIKNDVYFWDKGVANISMEMEEFFKINKAPIIRLNNSGEIDLVRVNNQVRDSHLDMEPEKVNLFYEAMKLFNDTLYDNSYKFKMENGDIIVLDNVRCLHGRNEFEANSDRHLETVYLDWDEARCCRRRLLQKVSGH